MISVSEKWSMEFFNIRRNGTNSQRGLQKNILNDIAQKHDKTYSKTLHYILKMQTELLTLALSNYVLKKSKIQHSPPYNIPIHNGPSLPRRPGPSKQN